MNDKKISELRHGRQEDEIKTLVFVYDIKT